MTLMEKPNNFRGNIIMEIKEITLDQCLKKLATIFGLVGLGISLLYVIKTGQLPVDLHKPFLIMYISAFAAWLVGFVMGIFSIKFNTKE